MIHGSRTGNNEFLIDGAANAGTGGWSYAPPVDAIEEFKVDTASTDASYGRTSGGVVNLTLKSGTNQLHGSGTMLFRGTALDSNQIQNILNNISNKGHKYVDGEGMVRIRQQIRDILFREKYDTRLDVWIKEIRQRAIIEVRL